MENLKLSPCFVKCAGRILRVSSAYLIAFVLLIHLLQGGVRSQSTERSENSTGLEAAQRSISGILNDDGTLKPGLSGNFDAKGYRLECSADGSPRFVPQSEVAESAMPPSCGDRWDGRFVNGGLNALVYALAVSGTDIFTSPATLPRQMARRRTASPSGTARTGRRSVTD
ncbi:MAG: hypothetical protein IPN69_14840 [Acidobacteria bacterium]|nr:hypothetical protein [Acidobacteriota bacterium]MBK8811987.1 hypothetical protein [Acidobacteriota bacterium]